MPKLGFPVTAAYPSEFEDWFNLTDTATRFDEAQDLSPSQEFDVEYLEEPSSALMSEPDCPTSRTLRWKGHDYEHRNTETDVLCPPAPTRRLDPRQRRPQLTGKRCGWPRQPC